MKLTRRTGNRIGRARMLVLLVMMAAALLGTGAAAHAAAGNISKGEAKKIALRFVARHDKLDDTGDYKTALQEVVQKNREEHVEYVLIEESGPAHDRHFVIEVHLNSNVIGRGEGKSKKIAEQMAAKEALSLMGIVK